MKKSLCVLVAVAVAATPALAQVRPANCAPVFPLMDKVAAVAPDVVVPQAAPAAVASRGFFGLPFLPLLLAGGACAIACGGGGGGSDSTPVSPA